jgi:hypothetical protein
MGECRSGISGMKQRRLARLTERACTCHC